MLITLKLRDCPDCSDTAPLVEALDCLLTDRAQVMLQNARFGFRRKVDISALKDAIRYKRILVARSFNSAYGGPLDLPSITSKVKQLTYGL